MNKNRKAKDPRRSRVFAEAFDYLKRNKDVRTQKQLAERMGVTPETVSRILKARVDVSEDAISKLQTASGCVFNLQWLRGESDVMLAADLKQTNKEGGAAEATPPSQPDMGSLMNAVIAAKDDAIIALKRELAAKEDNAASQQRELSAKNDLIVSLRDQLSAKDAVIATKEVLIKTLQQQVSDLRAQLAIQKGLLDGYPFSVGVAESDRTQSRI